MKLLEIILISIGLASDAFAVSLSKGLVIKKDGLKNAFFLATSFAIFQGIMPILGFILGSSFKEYIVRIDHYVAFFLLFLIGVNMIREAFKNETVLSTLKFKELMVLSLATSIDAFSVGITFSLLNKLSLFYSVTIIAIVTFILSFGGFFIGKKLGDKMNFLAKIIGGVILILIGLKILFEHLNIVI